MVDVEKVKAGLKCCISDDDNELMPTHCDGCPYRDGGMCKTMNFVLRDALAVIEDQEKHINELHGGIVQLRDAMMGR